MDTTGVRSTRCSGGPSSRRPPCRRHLAAVTSRRPIRSPKLVSANTSSPSDGSGPANVASSRRMSRPSLPGAHTQRRRDDVERHLRSGHRERQTLREIGRGARRPPRAFGPGEGPVRVGVDVRAELDRGDLGQVDHVVDPHLARRELDARVPVDREVAERMGRGGARAQSTTATTPTSRIARRTDRLIDPPPVSRASWPRRPRAGSRSSGS